MRASLSRIIRKASRLGRMLYFSFFPDRQLLARWNESPRALLIETVNICNANCVFCAYQYQKRRKQIMGDELFTKTLSDYVAIGGGDLAMSVVVGDPLLDPKFAERVALARSETSIRRIGTVTNCLNLHRVGAATLLRSGLTSIYVSTTGFDPEMYERVYRSSHYEQMKQNVLDLLRTNRALGKLVKITIGLRVDRPVEEVLRMPDFQEIKELADAVDFNPFFDSWSGRIRQGDLPSQMKLRPTALMFMKKRIPCGLIWSGLAVLVDGTVTACGCRDLDGDSDLVLGNIRDMSLRQMWHSERLRSLRKDWFSGRNIPNICRDCTHYHPYTHHMLKEFRDAFM